LAAAGLSAAAITVVGTVTEVGLIAYAAYDVGKTAVEVKEDLDAGRLDAAASKVGGLTGTIIGGVGASKVLGKGVTGAAGEVVEQASVRTIGKPQASLGGLETSEGEAIIHFGRNENQFRHTFRHTDDLGLDRMAIQKAIEESLAENASRVVDGVPYNAVVVVAGKRLQYTAFRLSDKTLNVGRIHEIK